MLTRLCACGAVLHVWKTHVDGGLSKFESRAELHVFLGIDPRTKAYILGTLPHMKLERTPHCTFNESRFPWKETTARRLTGPPTSTAEGDPLTSPTPADLAPQRPSRLWCPSARQLENIVNQADSHPASQQPSDVQASVSVFMEDVVAGAGSQRPAGAPNKDPRTHREAVQRPDGLEWRAAEISEVQAHIDQKTVGPPTRPPPHCKPIQLFTVFKTKRDKRKKARIVVRGYQMMPGVDFNDTFSPVAKVTSIRLMIALAVRLRDGANRCANCLPECKDGH